MPSFSQSAINYAGEYSRALSLAYPYKSYFAAIWASWTSQLYKPGMGKTMYIPKLATAGAHAVASRDQITGTFNRNFNNSYQAVTLAMDREWDTLVDPADVDETNLAASIANITRAFNEQQKIPEMDAYMAAKLYSFTDSADRGQEALTSANVIGQWDRMLGRMQDCRVPMDRVVCYMSPGAYALFKTGSGVTRCADVSGNGSRSVDRAVDRFDGVPIVVVPSDMLRTGYVFTEGWAPADGALQMDMLLVDAESVIAPVKYESSLISPPTAQSRGKWLYYERYYYDVFRLDTRPGSVVVHIAA